MKLLVLVLMLLLEAVWNSIMSDARERESAMLAVAFSEGDGGVLGVDGV